MTISPVQRSIAVIVVPLIIVWIGSFLPTLQSDVGSRLQHWCVLDFKPVTSPKQPECSLPPPSAASSGAASTLTPISVLGGAAANQPKSLPQARIHELDLRFGFLTASAMIRVVAAIVILVTGGVFVEKYITGSNKRVLVSLGTLGVVGGIIVALVAMHGNDITTVLLKGPIQAAKDAEVTDEQSIYAFTIASEMNLVMSYIATGGLVALFAWLAYSPDNTARCLQILQFGLLMGAALFTAAAYGNTQVAEWAKGLLDQSAMPQAGAVIDRLPAYWGMLGSIFLASTAGVTYLAITSGVTDTDDTGGQALAMRTVDGKDFKFFGWLVNTILVLSPIWAALKIPGSQPF